MSGIACDGEAWNAGPETVKAGCMNSRPTETATAAATAKLGKQTPCMPRMAGLDRNFKPRGMRAPYEFRTSLHGRRRSQTMESGMATRKNLSKKTRFEVFKRDKFTCQYCGAAAPAVVLHVDHVQPVAGGGGNDILNLLTACQDCNGGKGARRLDDGGEVQKQHAQLAELQARREQIEMMLQWRETLLAEKHTDVELVANAIAAKANMHANSNGMANIQRWLKRFPVELLLRAVDESFEVYLEFNVDEVDEKSWEKAFAKIPAVANVLSQSQAKPYLKDLFYIQGILRKRLRCKWLDCIEDLEHAHLAGLQVDYLGLLAKRSRTADDFYTWLEEALDEIGGRK
jgi:hypothetical protein